MNRLLNPYPRGDIRYVGTPDEQIDDLRKVTLDDVREFYAHFYGASHATVVINGQFDSADMQKLSAEIVRQLEESVGVHARALAIPEDGRRRP